MYVRVGLPGGEKVAALLPRENAWAFSSHPPASEGRGAGAKQRQFFAHTA